MLPKNIETSLQIKFIDTTSQQGASGSVMKGGCNSRQCIRESRDRERGEYAGIP